MEPDYGAGAAPGVTMDHPGEPICPPNSSQREGGDRSDCCPPLGNNEHLEEPKEPDPSDGADWATPRDRTSGGDQGATGGDQGATGENQGATGNMDLAGPPQGEEPTECSVLLEENPERECPICTEPYDGTSHKQSFLNCSHTVCNNCIRTIMEKASRAELGRVMCPMCRQRTPMMQWEIHKMQEQMMDNVAPQVLPLEVAPGPPVRRPGLCGALEYRFHKRFYTTRMFPFAPCCRYPIRCIAGLRSLERRNRGLYRCVLGLLFLAEILSFFLIFLPIIILILVIVFTR